MESSAETKIKETQESLSSLKTETGGKIAPASASPSSDKPWQEWIDVAVDFLAKVPDEIGNFFSDYKKPLITLLLIASGAATVYITLAVLDAIDDIPLLAPVLELVGLGYAGWFIYRYLWRASNREELIKEFEALKTQVVGEKTQDS